MRPDELAAWRLTLAAGWRHGVFRALRQVLEQAARWRWIDENPARYVKNPKPKPPTIEPFVSWAEIEAIADELDPPVAAIPLFAVGTGLRREEWCALERRDVDRGRRRRHRRARLHPAATEAVREDEQAEKARPTAPARPRGSKPLPRVLTRPSCSRPPEAATSTSSASASVSRSRR